jgi:hypothetical protein
MEVFGSLNRNMRGAVHVADTVSVFNSRRMWVLGGSKCSRVEDTDLDGRVRTYKLHCSKDRPKTLQRASVNTALNPLLSQTQGTSL